MLLLLPRRSNRQPGQILFPQSSRTYLVMAQAYQRKNDTAGAIRSLEKAIELDPQNGQAKRMLDTLKKWRVIFGLPGNSRWP